MKTYLNTSLPIPKGKSLLIFDSNCLFCNRAILIVLRFERSNQFLIAARDNSTISTFIESNHQLASEDSVILISNNKAFTKSDAIKEIAKKLTYWLSPLIILILITPKRILTRIYSFIAENRNSFSHRNKCSTIIRERYIHKTFNP